MRLLSRILCRIKGHYWVFNASGEPMLCCKCGKMPNLSEATAASVQHKLALNKFTWQVYDS